MYLSKLIRWRSAFLATLTGPNARVRRVPDALVQALCIVVAFAAAVGWAQPELAFAQAAQDIAGAEDAEPNEIDVVDAVDDDSVDNEIESGEESTADDGVEVPPVPTITQPVFEVSDFDIHFNTPIDGIEPADLLLATAFFSPVNDVFTAPQEAAGLTQVALGDLNDERVRTFDATGLQVVVATLLAYLNDEVGLIGVVVAPHPEDIATDLSDLREGRTQLRIIVYTAQVSRVRTMGSGDRIPIDDRENHPSHDRVRLGSPLRTGSEPGTGDVLWRGRLDDYLFQLNRHPGRRVDAAISSGLTPGTVTLDYLISESKPWYIYFQLSNTGTESTDELRERFGFTHNQFSGADDIFSIDYVTSNFDETHAVSVSYERPLSDSLRARVFARYSEYTAADVGFADISFNGDDFAVGGDLIYNIAQFDELFVDVVGGLQFMQTRSENSTLITEGEEAFFLGHVGLEIERLTDISQTTGYIDLKWNFNSGDMMEMTDLGRFDPDEKFVILTFGVTRSFFLEPLLNYDEWADISDPDTSTLAHEVIFGLRGQTSLGNRLIPTFESTAGGLYTVRGYDESAVAGDNALIATAEYRYHVARGLALRNPDDQPRLFGQPFRTAPETVYGSADWDLVLKVFFDAARVTNSDRASFETNETLLGTGVGFELSIRNNIRFRGDWGIALEDAGRVSDGDNRFHFILTILY